jgi:hypothetical protein
VRHLDGCYARQKFGCLITEVEVSPELLVAEELDPVLAVSAHLLFDVYSCRTDPHVLLVYAFSALRLMGILCLWRSTYYYSDIT